MHFLSSKPCNQGLFSGRVKQGPAGSRRGGVGEGREGGGRGEVEVKGSQTQVGKQNRLTDNTFIIPHTRLYHAWHWSTHQWWRPMHYTEGSRLQAEMACTHEVVGYLESNP